MLPIHQIFLIEIGRTSSFHFHGNMSLALMDQFANCLGGALVAKCEENSVNLLTNPSRVCSITVFILLVKSNSGT